MRRVACYVDFHLRGPGVKERTQAFQRLVLLLCILRVLPEVVDYVDIQSGVKKTMIIDWDWVDTKVAKYKATI